MFNITYISSLFRLNGSSYLRKNATVSSLEQNVVTKPIFGAIATLSFLGNLLLCVVISRKRSMLKQPYNVLILNLAVTDMLTGKFHFILLVLLSVVTKTDSPRVAMQFAISIGAS